MGPLVLGLLWLLMHKTRFGVLVRAATQDREMVGALGVNQALLFTGTLFLGAVPGRPRRRAADRRKLAANPHMDISRHRRGLRRHGGRRHGLGARRVPGRAADRRSCRRSASWSFRKITLVLVFLLMALVLVVRPWGLLGRPDAGHGRVVLPEGILALEPLRPAPSTSSPASRWRAAAGAAAGRRCLHASRSRSRCCASRWPPSA